MATLNELSFNILNKFVGGRSTNNEYISLDQIKFNINYYRSLLLYRDLQKGYNREAFEQELTEMSFDLIQTGSSDINLVLRSKKAVPPLIRLQHSFPISIYDTEFDRLIPVETFHRKHWKKYATYTSKTPTAVLRDGHVEFTTNLLSQSIHDSTIDVSEFRDRYIIRGIFENPSEAYIFNGEDPTTVDDLHYPVSGDYQQRISQSLMNGDFEIMLQTPNDTKHNTVPDHQLANR